MGNTFSHMSKPTGVWPNSHTYDYRWPAGPSFGEDVLLLPRRSILRNRQQPSAYVSLGDIIEKNESDSRLAKERDPNSIYDSDRCYYHKLIKVPNTYRPRDSLVSDSILQMGLMPAAITLPRLGLRLKSSEEDVRLKRTIATFQSLLREKEEEIFILEQKLHLANDAVLPGPASDYGNPMMSESEKRAARERLSLTLNRLIGTLFVPEAEDHRRRDEMIDTLDKIRLCLRTFRSINDEDWYEILEPIGDSFIQLQKTQQLRNIGGADLSNDGTEETIVPIARQSETAQIPSASAAKRTEKVRIAKFEEKTPSEYDTEPEEEMIQQLALPRLQALFPSGKNKTKEAREQSIDLHKLAEMLSDEQVNKLLALRVAQHNKEMTEELSQTQDSGVVTPFSTQQQQPSCSYTLFDHDLLSPRSVVTKEDSGSSSGESFSLSSSDLCAAMQLAIDSALIDLPSNYVRYRHDATTAPKATTNESLTRLIVAIHAHSTRGLRVSEVQQLVRSLSNRSTSQLYEHATNQLSLMETGGETSKVSEIYEELRREAMLLQLTVLHFVEPNAPNVSSTTATIGNQIEYLRAAQTSGISTDELDLLVRDLYQQVLKLHPQSIAPGSIDILARLVVQSCKLLDHAIDLSQQHLLHPQLDEQKHKHNNETALGGVKLESQIQTLLDTRSMQSSRIKELEELIETYRLTATQLNSSMSRDIAALSSIANDLRGATPRGSTSLKSKAEEEFESLASEIDTQTFANALEREGQLESRTPAGQKYDVHINVKLDAGKVEGRVKLIECERMIDELQRKIAVISDELQQRNAEVTLKDRNTEELRNKLENMQQLESNLKQQISILSTALKTISEQASSGIQPDVGSIKAGVSTKIELADMDTERNWLYEAGRADKATIHKLQVTIRESELVNRKLKSQLDILQSSHGALLREINSLKSTIDDLSMDLDAARLQCASWQRKASNYRHIAANIMSKLNSYKKQIRTLVLANNSNVDSTRTSFDFQSLRNGIQEFDDDDEHTETVSFVTDQN